MSYVGTPEFESRRAAFKAEVDQRRADFEARLEILGAEQSPPSDVMSPEEFASRLVMDRIPRE